MPILQLTHALVQAANVFAAQNNLQFEASSINNIHLINTQTDLPNNTLIINNEGETFESQKVIVNQTLQPSPQTIAFEQKITNEIQTQTTQGYQFGLQLDQTALIHILFNKYNVTVATSFKYNPSTQIIYNSEYNVTWRENVTLEVPPRTKTVVTYSVLVGLLCKNIHYKITLSGQLLFRLKSDPSKTMLLPLTYKGNRKQSVGDILSGLYNIETSDANDNLDIQGSLHIKGALGLKSSTRIKNIPYRGNPSSSTEQTIPGQQATSVVFL
ncbi:hypothetical protein CAI16_08070 [Virgibacillus dokdonensis]|uniref:Uncharacterized protein n=1 Tax=Virgibacillus dokdonensis TaxID=302167 RepID=A0A3E0WRI2_9BACI|nr:ETX/MTX2 family pore-forming toxin [Virgibacillus dokdonensis]RFA35584.1 hypothetical protein CAI16_08070 [Virgibacillus dokdonensis]